MNNEVKKTFTPIPMTSFCSSRKTSSYIVRAKLYHSEGQWGLINAIRNVVKCDTRFLRLTHFLALLPVKILKLIINLIVMINVSFT